MFYITPTSTLRLFRQSCQSYFTAFLLRFVGYIRGRRKYILVYSEKQILFLMYIKLQPLWNVTVKNDIFWSLFIHFNVNIRGVCSHRIDGYAQNKTVEFYICVLKNIYYIFILILIKLCFYTPVEFADSGLVVGG